VTASTWLSQDTNRL